MADLSGTGRIADDLYLMAHHEVSGKPLLQPRALGIGLAGGLLAELMLAGRIATQRGWVELTDSTPAQDELERSVQELVSGERERHPVRTWLQFLAYTAAEDVAGRLEKSGYLAKAGGRGPWRSSRWVPTDPDCAFASLLRVRSALDATRPPSIPGATLVGLAAACGLGFRVAQTMPQKSGRSLEEAARQLPPAVADLIAQTQAAVDSALLSHRV